MLVERVIDFLNKYDLADKTIIVGFSGGYDSMCLLDILSKIKNLEGYDDLKIVAAHFNHNWRGKEALHEQEVCRLFAASKGFEFYTKIASPSLKKTENDARIARYEFFEECVENFDGDAVFTAHNKDDNAETVLYRAIKGTGLVGLKGISEKRDIFYRPLLKTPRSEISAYCEKYNLTPNFDSSNNDINYRRNYIRLNIMPALEKINPSVIDSLNTLAEVAVSEDSIIEEYLKTIREKIYTQDGRLISQEYEKLSEPVKMRILREFIQNLDLDFDFKKIKEIYDFIEKYIEKRNGSTLSLASAKWLYVDDKIIETLPRKSDFDVLLTEIPPVEINGDGLYEFGDKKISVKKFVQSEIFVFPESTANFVYVDLSAVELPLQIRVRQEGDIINPFGMKGTMKLKKYFNSKGVSRHNRDSIILIAKDNEVLWVSGVGLSNKIGVTEKPTHVIEIKQ